MISEMTGAEYTINFLERKGVRIVSGIPGGANLPLYDALQRSSLQHVLARHEQGAGFIAQGMARSTGEVGVCFASSGPGVTNLATALADAMMDSIPILAITGQVPTSLIGTDAFQEVDAVGMMTPITKGAFMVRHIADLPSTLEEAYSLMRTGRPGPVLVDIPKDIQLATIPNTVSPRATSRTTPSLPANESIQSVVAMLKEAKRPLIYAGGGVIHANASAELRSFLDALQIPAALTLMGLGILPEAHPLNLGMLGMHGKHSTNHAIEEADLILALGVRFDDRATGDVRQFARKARIIHIDIDASEIGKNRSVDLGICADLKTILSELTKATSGMAPFDASWILRIETMKQEDAIPDEWLANALHPVAILRHLGRIAPHDAIFTTDVGQHQMWAAQHLALRGPRSFLTSGGAGTMGFGLPAAIGAALACPDRPVICITGDGSLFMNIAELSTAAELQLNIKVLLFNNNHLGLVRQQQDLFYQKNFFAIRYDRPTNYALVAKGMGFAADTVSPDGDVVAALESAIHRLGPFLLDIPIDEEQHVLPMVPPGKANTQTIMPIPVMR